MAEAVKGKAPEASPAPQAEAETPAPIEPVWMMPQRASHELRSKMWLDYQNDVKVSDVQLAAREGYESVEHTKRYTTLGMATDQGKLRPRGGPGARHLKQFKPVVDGPNWRYQVVANAAADQGGQVNVKLAHGGPLE